SSNTFRVTIAAAAGTYAGAPSQRAWTLRLHRPADWVADLAPVQALANGQLGLPITRLIHNETAMPLGAPNGAPDADTFEVTLPSSPVTVANQIDLAFATAASPWTSRDIGSVAFEGGAA